MPMARDQRGPRAHWLALGHPLTATFKSNATPSLVLGWVYRRKGDSGKILAEFTKLKPTLQRTREAARMCLAVTRSREKKDILASRESNDGQACHLSNWLPRREFKFFSKREAAVLGAGSGEVHRHQEQGLFPLRSQRARDPGSRGSGRTGGDHAGLGFGWRSPAQRTFAGWLSVRTRTPPPLPPVTRLVGWLVFSRRDVPTGILWP